MNAEMNVVSERAMHPLAVNSESLRSPMERVRSENLIRAG